MRRYCAPRNSNMTHGLGLVLKNPQRSYKRICILSKKIAIYEGRPIILRLIPNTILTNTTRSVRLSSDDAHYLASMSLFSYANDPLSKKLQYLRMSMIKGLVKVDRVNEIFIKDRMFKMGSIENYSYE